MLSERFLFRACDGIRILRDSGVILWIVWEESPGLAATLLVEGAVWVYDVNGDICSNSRGQYPPEVLVIFRDLARALAQKMGKVDSSYDRAFEAIVVEVFGMLQRDEAGVKHSSIDYED